MWVVAYTKVFAIRKRLDDRVNYITNGEKTSLAASITYIANPEKTEQFFFTSALNCGSVDTALSEMAETKQRFGKTGGVLGYHFIQSFAPGEVTPEQAHEIGKEFARRLFGDHFEVVIGTHLDKHHLHNHLVVNSVSCIDGHKYHSSPESYYSDVRGTSDELCRENALSIITIHPKSYEDAQLVGRAIRDGVPVVLNLTGVSEAVAYRIVDFSAGVVFGVRGSIERVTPRVFLLSPAQVNIKVEEPQAPSSAHDLFAD